MKARVEHIVCKPLQICASFPTQVDELVKSKLEKPKKLLQLAAREWREIDDNTLVFDRPAAEVAELRKLIKDDLLDFFQVPQIYSRAYLQHMS